MSQMFVDWNKDGPVYPNICVFYGTRFDKRICVETYCGYPFKDDSECIYEKEGDCSYKMTGSELLEDWARLKFLTEPMLYKGEK